MEVSIEISYYPLADEFENPIGIFINKIKKEHIKIETGIMSSVITGKYDEVLPALTNVMKDLMGKYPSVFNIKISNTCSIH